MHSTNHYFTNYLSTRHTAPVVGALALIVGVGLVACQPTVKIEAPDKPIVINLNIKIEQEVRVKIDRELDEEFADNPDLFE